MLNFKTLALGSSLALASLASFAQAPAAPTAPATPRIDQREANQEARIQKGVASGQLTPKETYRLEKEQAAVGKAEANAKADGKVTRKERHRIVRLQDKASHDIHAQKHDAQTAKP
jgi:hypothetical protein